MASSNVQHASPLQLLPAKLWFNETSTNYREWKASTLYLIQRQGLIGYVDGSCSASGSPTNPDYDVWKRTDEPLKKGILSLLEKDVVKAVKHLNTSRDIWLKLETMFCVKYGQDHTGREVEDETRQHRVAGDRNNYSKELYRAVVKRDWTIAKEIFDNNVGAIGAKITSTHATALHIAVEAGEESIVFLTKLVELLPGELIGDKDAIGNTALNTAAAVGNKSAATILALKIPDLVYTPNILGDFPVHTAAKHAKRDMLIYLISVTKDDRVDQNPYAGLSGLALLISTIQADFFDIALYLVKKYPCLARLKFSSNSALKSIAEKKFMFENNRIYIPSITKKTTLVQAAVIDDNIESLSITFRPSIKTKLLGGVINIVDLPHSYPQPINNALLLLVKPAEVLGEPVGQLLMEILKCLCQEMKTLSDAEALDLYRDPILIAAKLGNREVVEQIVEAFPDAIYSSNPASFQNIFHVAVENRAIRVFNLIYRMGKHTHLYLDVPDIKGNNLLHLAAKLAPSHKLAGLPNAAFQMRRELQWYREVEELLHPHCREQLNYEGKTPRMIFLEEHRELRAVGEKWVKDTVNSCAITAALISTIFFAAAITVPGGSNSSNGFPLFGTTPAFTFFAISNAISLIASATSLLVFLDLTTCRYTEEDFLSYIPVRLIIGMISLVVSIVFMMLTFSVTIYLVFGRHRYWVLGLVFVVTGYIVYLFIIFQQGFLENAFILMESGFFGERALWPAPKFPSKVVRNRKSTSHEFI